jgi:hypothetical protein
MRVVVGRLLLFTAIAACGGSLTGVSSGSGSSDRQLLKNSDGSPTGNGTTCSLETSATKYSVGQSVPSPDGCNECTCTAEGVSCTTKKCEPQACTTEAKVCPDGTAVGRTGPNCEFAPCPGGTDPDGTCTVDGKTYKQGEQFPAPDGCNTCSCGAGGLAACTEKACAGGCLPPQQPDPGTVCPAVIVYAKNPTDGECCEYSDPCHAPAGWKQFYSETDCQK